MVKLPRIFLIFLIFSFLSANFAFGQEFAVEISQEQLSATLEDTVRSLSITTVIIATLIIAAFVGMAFLIKQQEELLKKVLFAGIAIPAVLATIFLVASTLILNAASETKGPVHWHADFEVWDCSQRVDLINPTGFSNKVGTPTLHEHDDLRIHVEGVVLDYGDVSLKRFFQVIGGDLSDSSIRIPTDDGIILRENGDPCPDGGPGLLQVFVYKIIDAQEGQRSDFVYEQTKLQNPESYVLSSFASVPPGDCIIIEFTSEFKDKTERLCEQYEVQKLKGELRGD